MIIKVNLNKIKNRIKQKKTCIKQAFIILRVLS